MKAEDSPVICSRVISAGVWPNRFCPRVIAMLLVAILAEREDYTTHIHRERKERRCMTDSYMYVRTMFLH